MDISQARRKSSEELVDGVAHDSGIVRGDAHLTSSATRPTGNDIHRSRHDHPGAVGDCAQGAARDTSMYLAADLLADVGTGAAGAVEMGSLALFAVEAWAEGVKAYKKGQEIGAAYDNDAVNIALSNSGVLAFDPSFSTFETMKRPGVSTNAVSALSIELGKPKNVALRQVLQARADEGFLAADRAMNATANVPPDQRAAAIHRWFVDNGYADRMLHDVAFGKGVEYHAFVQEPLSEKRGLSLEKARAEVTSRSEIDRTVLVPS